MWGNPDVNGCSECCFAVCGKILTLSPNISASPKKCVPHLIHDFLGPYMSAPQTMSIDQPSLQGSSFDPTSKCVPIGRTPLNSAHFHFPLTNPNSISTSSEICTGLMKMTNRRTDRHTHTVSQRNSVCSNSRIQH